MSRVLTIGIDIGTTGTKTVLLDAHQGILAEASREATLYSDRAGFAEADPSQWLANVTDSIRQMVREADVKPEEVRAISTSGMVPAVIPLDASGHPLRRAILQNDARAHVQITELAGQLAKLDLVALTGSALTQQSVAPTLMWLAAHEPQVFEAMRFVVGSYDWILMALGATPHLERNWAMESGLFLLSGEPLHSVLAAAGLDESNLPPVVEPGTQLGSLSASAAEACGLAAGIPLVVGGADHVLSAFAAGVDEPGNWLIKLGGAGDILVAADRPIVDPRLYLDAHPIPGHWLPNGCMASSGSLIRWFQSLIGGEELTALDREAAARPAAQILCLPYFLGEKSPLHDPELRGAFVGLHLGHTRADMYRSVLEGIAFGFRHHTEVFRELGIELNRAMITNGGSKSVLWKQIHAEVLGCEVYPVLNHPGASLGAAIIAAVGVGAIDGWADSRRFLHLGEQVRPDPDNVARYDEAYLEWRELGRALEFTSHSIARRTQS